MSRTDEIKESELLRQVSNSLEKKREPFNPPDNNTVLCTICALNECLLAANKYGYEYIYNGNAFRPFDLAFYRNIGNATFHVALLLMRQSVVGTPVFSVSLSEENNMIECANLVLDNVIGHLPKIEKDEKNYLPRLFVSYGCAHIFTDSIGEKAIYGDAYLLNYLSSCDREDIQIRDGDLMINFYRNIKHWIGTGWSTLPLPPFFRSP